MEYSWDTCLAQYTHDLLDDPTAFGLAINTNFGTDAGLDTAAVLVNLLVAVPNAVVDYMERNRQFRSSIIFRVTNRLAHRKLRLSRISDNHYEVKVNEFDIRQLRTSGAGEDMCGLSDHLFVVHNPANSIYGEVFLPMSLARGRKVIVILSPNKDIAFQKSMMRTMGCRILHAPTKMHEGVFALIAQNPRRLPNKLIRLLLSFLISF